MSNFTNINTTILKKLDHIIKEILIFNNLKLLDT